VGDDERARGRGGAGLGLAAAYADAEAWPRWNAELKSATLEGPLGSGAAARMGHRHLVEPTAAGSRLTNTIYVGGPLAAVWRRILGPRAQRTLPGAQAAVVELALSPRG
jgi:hypothetical protein